MTTNAYARELAETKASSSGSGDYFRDGRGVVIIKDLQLFKGEGDPKTFKMEAYVKSSAPVDDNVAPNKPGTSVVLIKLFNKIQGDKERTMGLIRTILGPDAPPQGSDALADALVELLRMNERGYTEQNTVCPVRGVELAYETRKVTSKKGNTIVVPTFTHIAFNAETVKTNRDLLDGKTTLEKALAA